jgi:signal transduction histidine kinase
MRMRAWAIELVEDDVSLVELATEAMGEMALPAALRGVTLQLDVRSHAHVHGCRRWLEQALLNVMDNAIRHGPRHRPVRVVVEAEAGRARLEVHDAGPGVPRRWREQVFEPFFVLAPGGDGLGLTVARAALRAHGGEAAFLDGKQSVLRLELPCHASVRVH